MTQPTGECEMSIEFDYGTEDVPEADDAAIDRWHDGALDCYRGRVKASDDKDYLEGWAFAKDDIQHRVAQPERPEGYYHMPLGTFD